MLSLKELSFNNIGRFVEKQTIDFTVRNKLTQVNGLNKNTGGSSGAAKSTIFHALDYLLGINDIPATALQSRLTKDSVVVKGVFEVDGKDFIIERSKKGGLSVKYGDETITGNVKLAEEKIDEIIGVPRKLFKKMVHKKQKEGGFFLNLTAKESYDFLMKALGLEGFTKKTDIIDQEIKELVSQVESINTQIESTQNLIDEYTEMLDQQEKPTCDITKEHLDQITKKAKIAKDALEELKTQKERALESILKPQPIATDIPMGDVEKLEKEVQELKEEANKIRLEQIEKKAKIQKARDALLSKINQIPQVKSNAQRLAQEMKNLIEEQKHIEEQKCPTCMQQWIGNSAAEKIQSITDSINEKKFKIIELKPIIEQKPELQNKLESIDTLLANIEKEQVTKDIDNLISEKKHRIINIKAERQQKLTEIENEYLKRMAEYNAQIDKIKSEWDEKIKDKQYEFFNIGVEYKEKNGEVNSYQKALATYKKNVKDLQDRIAERKKQKSQLEKEQTEKANKSEIASEAKRLIKTYTLQIFQDTLDYIGAYASDILSNIPNMSNCTIYFEGCKENKNGNIKDEVNAIINMDGYNNINIKTLSGGERTAIDLAVDLAVIDMVESKVGKGADFFILDEPFDGLEDINISQCLEVIKTVDTNKKIIIVDHNPIAKEMITDTITVVRNGEISEVIS